MLYGKALTPEVKGSPKDRKNMYNTSELVKKFETGGEILLETAFNKDLKQQI